MGMGTDGIEDDDEDKNGNGEVNNDTIYFTLRQSQTVFPIIGI